MCNHSNHKSEINIRLKHLDISSIKTYKIKCRTDTFIFWLLGGPENPVNARPSLFVLCLCIFCGAFNFCTLKLEYAKLLARCICSLHFNFLSDNRDDLHTIMKIPLIHGLVNSIHVALLYTCLYLLKGKGP